MISIPLIDIAAFDGGDAATRAAIAHQVDAAAREIGFMMIRGHGIADATLHGLQQAMDDFFGLPMSAKQRWHPPSVAVNRGYTSPLSERLSYSAGVASAADLFEAFNVGAACSDFPGLALDPLVYAENIWPDVPPNFRPGVEAWFRAAAQVAHRMTRIFALALGPPNDFFVPYQDHSVDVLRLNCYAMPPEVQRVEAGQMGMGAHTDYGMVTVLWADPVSPGLQVLLPDGRWVEAVPAPGALLINLGDMMARWTNDHWRSSMHRVLPPVDAQGRLTRRRSAAFFHDGNADALVSCLPSCCGTDDPPKYAPVTVAEHLRQKLAGSRGLSLNAEAQREASRILSAID